VGSSQPIQRVNEPWSHIAQSDSLHYQLLYDVRTSIPDGWEPLVFLIPLFVIGLWAYRHHRTEDATSRRALVFGFGLMFCSGFGMLLVVSGSLLPHIGLRVRMASGRYEVLEGVVADFEPGYGGTSLEQWTLETPTGPRRYSYAVNVLAGGYDGSGDRRGLLKNGAHVRVFDVAGRIARLEVAC
jgi:hypothetical protein